MPMSCFYDLPELGKEAVIHTHFVVREDAQLLYGFNHKQERALFRELIKTNGVGPKLALAILSGMTATQFVMSVEREEISSLVKLPGVGKKTAERLVVEMKDRLKGLGQPRSLLPGRNHPAREREPAACPGCERGGGQCTGGPRLQAAAGQPDRQQGGRRRHVGRGDHS